MVLKVATFHAHCTDKQQVMKVAEEMMEVFAAWQELDAFTALADKGLEDAGALDCAVICLENELADVITAACNLAERYKLDMRAAMERCEARNRARGRL